MMRSGRAWPLAVGVLLAAGIAFNLGVVFVASRDPSFAVERDYYRKALAWDQTMAQERRNAELGWSLDVTIERTPEAGEARVAARVTDREGRPVDGARFTVEALHNARARDVVTGALLADGPGRYRATLPLHRAGLWELRLRAERGTDVFTDLVTRELGPVAPRR